MTFVSDDASYLVRGDPWRTLGRPGLLRLKPSAEGVVPDLSRYETVGDDEPGARVYELDPARDLGLAAAAECWVEGVVLLDRVTAGHAELHPAAGQDAYTLLDATLPQGELHSTQQQVDQLRALTAGPCWRLRYADAGEGAEALRELLAR
jgi:hypothetical protein